MYWYMTTLQNYCSGLFS